MAIKENRMTLKYLLAGLFVLCLAAPAAAQVETLYLAHGWEMDGLSADDNLIMTAANITDSKDDYTIAAQPEICRPIDITLTDANSSITAGAVTLTGTDCLDQVKTALYTIPNAGGTAVIEADSTANPHFKSITKIENGVITGEAAGDTLEVGYATYGTPAQFTAYGRFRSADDMYNFVEVGGHYSTSGNDKVSTSGILTTAVAEVTTGEDPFDFMAVGDMIFFKMPNGRTEIRTITTYTNDSNIVVNKAINIPTAGVGFTWQKRFVTTDPTDIVYVEVAGWNSAQFNWSIDANTNTGGVVQLLECTYTLGPDFPVGVWYPISTTTTATGGTQTPTSDSIDLTLAAFTYCRINWQFGTTDDDDTGEEDINATVTLRK